MLSTGIYWSSSPHLDVGMDSASPKPSPTYLQLRERLLGLKPDELGLAPSEAAPYIWGVLAELGYEVGSATLVALADGTTSLHYSTGGGLLGRPGFVPLVQASQALVAEAQKFVAQASPIEDFSVPAPGQVRFILLTYSGTYATSATEKSLASGEHPLAPLFQRLQDTLGQLRQLAVKKDN
jgi:hypothetical protein